MGINKKIKKNQKKVVKKLFVKEPERIAISRSGTTKQALRRCVYEVAALSMAALGGDETNNQREAQEICRF